MSFGDSKSNQKSTGQDTTTGHTTFDQTSTPINPDWVTGLVQGQAGRTGALAGTADPTQFIAGPNALLNTAAANATNLSGTPWNYDAALGGTAGVMNAADPSIAGNIKQFMDPYLNSVVNATSADLNHSDGIARANDDLALAGSGAFGGSGAALTKSATEGQLSRARATSLGGLRSAGYAQALGGATSQAQIAQNAQQQRLAAAGQLADIADKYGANSRANVAAQDAAGAPLQSIAQAKAQAPVDFQSVLTQLLGNLPLNLFQGQHQTGTEDQTGTEMQTGTNKGHTMSFGIKVGK